MELKSKQEETDNKHLKIAKIYRMKLGGIYHKEK